MRLQLVVNPTAGGGRASKLLPQVEQALGGHDLVVTPTRSLEHADELTAAAVGDDRVVVAMGGDGLVGRVAGTVAQTGGLMAVVPGGRGNDFARMVGIPKDVAAACAVVADGVETAVDLGTVDGRPFIGIASVGFDSEVQERVLRTRVPLGQLVYLYSALATVFGWKHARFTVGVNGEEHSFSGWSAVVANSGFYGGGMHIAPDASVTDGLLEVVTTSATSRRHFLSALPKVFKGTHLADPSVAVTRGATVTLTADRPFRVFADGDPIGALPCSVSVKPGALRLLVPAT
ncbi:MAG: diacylglycerol kinase family lipid kinase [Actinomycetota bacterium]|nr:diacylglycerol kinase family lipid kinase [Actinomycetota bacterium]